jgi:hypothetical protein
MSLLSNVVSSQFTKSERWLKLYRTIHHMFLKEEFIHKVDYELMVTQMNARITAVEAAANASIATTVTAVNAMMASHIHIVPQAPAGALPSGPAISVPAVVPPPPPSPLVKTVTTAMQAADNLLMGTGPATAPLADGISPDEMRATNTIMTDIGI